MEFVVLIILAIVLYILLLKGKGIGSYQDIGSKLEIRTSKLFRNYCKKFGGVSFLDIMIEVNGYTHQIDNILVTNNGVYVFELKNYDGWIYGNEKSNNWTYSLKNTYTYRSGFQKSYYSKHSFYNPIMQNETHVNALRKLLKLSSNIEFHNIVVFGDLSYLKKVTIYSSKNKVFNYDDLKEYILEEEKTDLNLINDELRKNY